ncbi:MAG: glucose-6-phosphate isomerase, partial [Clostridiaceae bacterium]
MERYQDESWRQSMRLRVDYNNMMSDQLGKRGLYRREIETMQQQIDTSIANMRMKRPIMRWRELPYNQEDVVKSILETAGTIREQFDDFVVLGIGGSALGPIAVQQALNHLHYNDLPREKRNGPRLFVEDNIDPERMAALLDVIDVEKTAFNVVSKSGGTSETMSQLLIISSLLHEKLGKDISTHLFATTDESKGNLIKIARTENLKTFFIPEGVGGRFSELCPVGLLA